MQILQLEQGGDEWHLARLGKPTASRFSEIITPVDGKKSKSYKKYIDELLGEKLAGEKDPFFKSGWMERGNELEAQARDTYSFLRDVEVTTTGIIFNDDLTIGASPDGLIGDNGGIEIKCVKSSTMIEYMTEDILPLTYKPQVMGNLWISEREYWDFIAYHPTMTMFIHRVYRDEEFIKKMATYLNEFLDEFNNKYEILKNKSWV